MAASPFTEEFINSPTILLFRYFALCGVIFIVFYVLLGKSIRRYKLQERQPQRADHLRDIGYSISSSVIFGLVFSLTVTVFRPYTQIYEGTEGRGLPYLLLSFVLMALVHDTYFYWTHRLIHTPRLFKIVHLVHHRSSNPSPWTSYAFHPLEALVQALVVPVIAVLLPVHQFALVVYFLLQFMHNVYGHLGYEIIPGFITRTSVGRLLNTSAIHNRHHKNVKGNYGLLFTFWDRWMGTQVR